MRAWCMLAAPVPLLAWVLACEDGPSAAWPPADVSVDRGFCEAVCEHAARCDARPLCRCDDAVETGALRPDWARAASACLEHEGCAREDQCEAAASRAIGVDPLALPPFVLRCLQKGDACGGSSTACRRLLALTSDVTAAADACFALPCPDYQACFTAVWREQVAPVAPTWR